MKRIVFFILCCCWICFSGCGGEKLPDGFPKVYPMTVTVTDGATPLSDVRLMFFPLSGGGSYASSGSTGANGVAKISTTQGSFVTAGIPAGEFVVTVEDIIRVESTIPPEELVKMPIGELNKYSAEQEKKRAEYPRKVPKALCKGGAIADRSPIRFTATEGKNEFAIDIAKYK